MVIEMTSMFVLAVGVNPYRKLIACPPMILVDKLPQIVCPQSHPFECLIGRQRAGLDQAHFEGFSQKHCWSGKRF
jgi:hypothetical protein